MPRYRMMYAKEGPAKYISHLDLIRAFERAARRAGLPIAFTRGFNRTRNYRLPPRWR